MKILLILFACFFLESLSCTKEGKLGPRVIPYSLFILIKKNGSRMPDSTLNNMKLFYYQAGTKKYISDFIRATNEGNLQAYDLGIQTTLDIGTISGDNAIKVFYLEYPDNSLDTLFVDYKHVGDDEAFNNSCYCHYPLQSVKFNGQVASPDPSITQQTVYLFNK